MTANVLQGEVDQVCIRVNTNGVSVRHEKLAFTHQGLPLFSKDGDVRGFSRYIQQFQAGVECENVRVFSDRICEIAGQRAFKNLRLISYLQNGSAVRVLPEEPFFQWLTTLVIRIVIR
jgi:hypothetical protein